MARSKQTSGKKDRENRKRNKKKKKEERKELRKGTSNKGKGFDSMIAYVDERGHLHAEPPPPAPPEMPGEGIDGTFFFNNGPKSSGPSKGKVTHLNEEKGYGFIRDSITGESCFFIQKNIDFEVKLHDIVRFEKEKNVRGFQATSVKKAI